MDNGQTSSASTIDEDVVFVSSTRVMCEGSGGALGHPRIYLDMGGETSVICKYCDRVFKLDTNAALSDHH